MSVEDRLRDALRAEAAADEAMQERWEAVRDASFAIRRRRRTQWSVAVAVSAAAVAAVAFVLLARGPNEKEAAPIARPGAPAPSYIVTVEDLRVLVRSAESGELVRALADGGDARNPQHVTVSPDGSQVYFTRPSLEPIDCPGPAEQQQFGSEIVRVPIGGGPLDVVVTNGSAPLVSPDGTRLAYTTNGSADGCGGKHELVVQPIGVDDGRITISDSETDGVALGPVSWSANGTKLLTEGSPPQSMRRELYVVGGVPDSPRVRKVEFPDQAADALEGPAAWGPDGSVVAPVTVDGTTSIVAFDPRTGEIRERLYEIPRPEYLTTDASGEYVLLGIEAEEGYTLARWDPEGGFSKLGAYRLRDFAWARGPSSMPERFVAVTQDGKLQIRLTADGSVERTLRDDVDLSLGPPHIAVSPDGRYVYMDRYDVEDCPQDPSRKRQKIARVSVESGEVAVFATGAEPAIGPVVDQIAYVTSSTPAQCGIHDTLIHTLFGSGAPPARRWRANEDDPSWTVSQPRWFTDHRGISFTLHDGDGKPSYGSLDTVEPFGADNPDRPPIREHLVEAQIPAPDGLAPVGYIGTDETLALREGADGTTELVTVGHSAPDRLLAMIDGVADDEHLVTSPPFPIPSIIPTPNEHVFLHVRPADREGEVDLVRYSVGALDPVKISEGVVSSAWLHR